jgi:ABC-type branched-subunit amino acid transport system permease subunit
MYKRPLDTLLATVGVALVLQQLARDLFGAQGDPVKPAELARGSIDVFGYSWPYRQLFTIVLAAASLAGLNAVLKYSGFGRQIRATVQNRELAETMGVSTRNVDRITFFLGSGLAGVGGVAISLISGTNPTLGTTYIIPAFLVVVAGGVGQLKGTLIAAWAVGSRPPSSPAGRAVHGAGHQLRPRRRVPPGAATGPVHRPDQVAGMTTTSPTTPGASRRDAAAHLRRSSRHRRRGDRLLVWAPNSLSAFRLGNLGKYCAWALAAHRHRPRLGSRRHAGHGPGRVLRARRLRMAMHMKLEAAGPEGVPDFMVLYGDGTMPGWWEPFRSGPFTLFAIVALPAAVAFILGYAILKRRVKGAYFAILTQALAVAFATLLIATIKQTGGFNGLNTFSTFFGQNLYDPR